MTALSLDPIEKKPLATFFPGSKVLSVGTFGCNLNCPFCQNASIAAAEKTDVQTETCSPQALVSLAADLKTDGNIGVAFTYNEPMIGYEFVRDTAMLVKERGMKNVVVTNGSVCKETLLKVLPFIDAFNIDLKGFTEEFYHMLGGDLKTVLDFITIAAKHSHIELTTLIIPNENDTPDEMRRLSSWVADVGPDIPLHITRFFPKHQMRDKLPTDIAHMRMLADIAKEKLKTVILGNV